MTPKRRLVTLTALFLVLALVASASDPAAAGDNGGVEEEVDEEKVDYAKGSVCQYCEYCKFCELCEEQCPCEPSPRQPACHMCKYCTYCKFCKICDTVCQPGGILDTVTGKLVSILPRFDQTGVDSDIAGVQEHIDKKKDEL